MNGGENGRMYVCTYMYVCMMRVYTYTRKGAGGQDGTTCMWPITNRDSLIMQTHECFIICAAWACGVFQSSFGTLAGLRRPFPTLVIKDDDGEVPCANTLVTPHCMRAPSNFATNIMPPYLIRRLVHSRNTLHKIMHRRHIGRDRFHMRLLMRPAHELIDATE